MSLKQKFLSTFVALTVVSGALAGTLEDSSAKKLTKAEIAALAGISGFIIGTALSNAGRGPDYHGDHRSAWERHVDRCNDRYVSYDEASDTYVGFDGYLHYCRL